MTLFSDRTLYCQNTLISGCSLGLGSFFQPGVATHTLKFSQSLLNWTDFNHCMAGFRVSVYFMAPSSQIIHQSHAAICGPEDGMIASSISIILYSMLTHWPVQLLDKHFLVKSLLYNLSPHHQEKKKCNVRALQLI